MNFIAEKPVHFIEQLLKSKNLKKISRCLLVSSFIEDGFRMLFAYGQCYFSKQTKITDRKSYCPYDMAHIIWAISYGRLEILNFSFRVSEIIHYNTNLPQFACVALAYLNGFISIFGSVLVIFEARMREGSIMLLAAVFLQFWIFDLINDPFVLPK